MKPIDINELWIGDRIRSLKSGLTGRYEGLHKSGKLKLRSEGKTILINPKYAEILDEEETVDEALFMDAPEAKPASKYTVPNEELDLHIQKLRPDLVNALPERILDIQLKSFDDFIHSASTSRQYKVLVIHGRGAGVLRQHIHESLRLDKTVREFRLVNNDGATEVFLH